MKNYPAPTVHKNYIKQIWEQVPVLTIFIISQNCDWNVVKFLPTFTHHIESESGSNYIASTWLLLNKTV